MGRHAELTVGPERLVEEFLSLLTVPAASAKQRPTVLGGLILLAGGMAFVVLRHRRETARESASPAFRT